MSIHLADTGPLPESAENTGQRTSNGARAVTQATPAGTRRFAERNSARPADFWQAFPRKLTVGTLGLGTYLGDCTDEEDDRYRESIRAAMASGINVLDTASNYRCQRSERVVGQAVVEAIAAGEVRRDEVMVCTKGGYIALDGETAGLARGL